MNVLSHVAAPLLMISGTTEEEKVRCDKQRLQMDVTRRLNSG